MKPLKPYMLKRWRDSASNDGYFYTCARPGRTGNPESKNADVADELVCRWVKGLRGPKTAIVSLLGRKPDGRSEFSFYSFDGGFDARSDRRLMFADWLKRWHPDLSITLREHPTCDFKTIAPETLDDIAASVRELMSAGWVVILVDSGGQTRTKAVCTHMKAIEDSSGLAS